MLTDISNRTCTFCSQTKIIEYTFNTIPKQQACGHCSKVLFALGDNNKCVWVVDKIK